MAFKFVVFLAFIAVASAGLLHGAQELERAEEYDSHPSYSFSYDVQDANTGDFKSQSETRDGDLVKGQYSLHDADGYRRVVDYSSDAVNGFRASVRREPLSEVATVAAAPAHLSVAVPAVEKTLSVAKTYTQPAALLRTYSAPALVHHAPAHTLLHAAPAVQLAQATHFVHAAPAATLVKSAPATLIAHHAPAVVHSSLATPHFQYAF